MNIYVFPLDNLLQATPCYLFFEEKHSILIIQSGINIVISPHWNKYNLIFDLVGTNQIIRRKGYGITRKR